MGRGEKRFLGNQESRARWRLYNVNFKYGPPLNNTESARTFQLFPNYAISLSSRVKGIQEIVNFLFSLIEFNLLKYS